MKERKLTLKQKAFCEEYIKNGGNGTKAARDAGYKGNNKTLDAMARENLAKPCIINYIEELKVEVNKKAKRTIMDLAEIQERRSAIARGEIADSLGFSPEFADQLKAMDALEKTQRVLLEEEKSKLIDDKRLRIPAESIGKAFSDINRLITSNIKYVFEGGRGGLKSSYVSLKIVEIFGNNPTMHACVIRKITNTLRDSVFAQINWAIDEMGMSEDFKVTTSPLQITYRKTGQHIYFRGCDKPTKLKSIKPPFGHIGILWVEEADQLSGAEELRSIEQSVLRGNGESYEFISYNPPKSKDAWVNREKQIPDKNRVIHTSCYTDAPREWLGEKFWSDAEHLKEVNPTAYEHEYLGIPNGSGGNVFDLIEIRTIADEEIERFDHIRQGVDFGWYPDQYAFLRTHYDAAREKIYLIDELYVNKQSNAQTGQWILEHGYDDFEITCDSAEPKSVNDYRDMGLPARGAVKGAGSVEYGFKWLQCRTIVIDPARTPNAYKEIVNYEYEREKEGNVVSGYPDGNDHAISALRYAYEPLFRRRGNSA